MNILVIEDELSVAEMICRSLEALGNSCVVAHDADRADDLLRSREVDAVTLDLGMPGRSGLDWLETVASLRPDLARKTLVITGQVLESRAVERLARCGAGLLAKPFTLDHLREAVRVQLDRPGGSRSAV